MPVRSATARVLALVFWALIACDSSATGVLVASAPGPKATVEGLVNAGFESGRGVGWAETSSGNYQIVTSTGGTPRSGGWWAWMGGDDNLTETLSQQVAIPAGADDVRLGFWYRIVTEEGTGTEYDSLRLTVVDSSSGAILAQTRLSNRHATSSYAQAESLNLTPYRGRSVRVIFTATSDASLATSFHIDDVFLSITTGGTTPAASNYSDIWWNPSESGWGLTIADHETQLFAVWYAYRQDGSPTWFVIPGGTFSQGRRIFTGDIYQTTGPRYDAATFNPNAVTVTRIGNMSLDFAPPGLAAGTALFSYTIGAVSASRQVQRQPFGSGPPAWGTDVTDIWWNAAESGWGLTLAQHGNNVFGVWFTYDASGQPLFVVMPGVTFSGADSFSGALYTTRGPYYGGPFDPSRVTVTSAGSATIDVQSIQGRKRLRFRPIVFGSAVDKQVERQPFGNSPPSEPPPTQNHTLTVSFAGNGTGRVTSSPAGIDCPGQCSATYAQGTSVTLAATPGATSRFTSFTGTCSTPNTTCSFFMSAPASVVATFEQLPPASTLAIAAVPITVEAMPGQFFSQRAATATGGQPPYSFLADTFANGAPPLGMGVDINGFLTGTPSSSYTSRQSFTFGICVRDLAQTLKCTTNTVVVAPASNVRWTIKSECNISEPVSYKFHDREHNLVWPSATTHYDVAYQATNNHNLACTAGALVCIGAQGGGNSWGVGFSGTGSCTNCCARCDTQTYAYTFGCAGPPPPPGSGGVTGSWNGTWNRTFGGLGSASYGLSWTLGQTGSSVSGSWSWRVNSCNGLCPDPVGTTNSGSFATGSVNGTALSLVTTGGTTFNGTVSGNSISGTSGGSFPGTFTLTR